MALQPMNHDNTVRLFSRESVRITVSRGLLGDRTVSVWFIDDTEPSGRYRSWRTFGFRGEYTPARHGGLQTGCEIRGGGSKMFC